MPSARIRAPGPEAPSAAGLPGDVVSSPLYNEDLAPTPPDRRTWGRWNLAALWVGMCVCIPTYMLGANLLKSGMNWWQAVLTILLGNLVVLIPMCLNAHAGVKYGIPFPVLIRASFGTSGSNVPAVARAIIACGWFGIQTWIGGLAIYELLAVFWPGWKALQPIPFLGINAAQTGCFLAFWATNVWFIVRGTESIKWLETLAAPFLIGIGVALLGWGVWAAGGSLPAVLAKSDVFTRPSVAIEGEGEGASIFLRPLGRATRYRVDGGPWQGLAPGVTETLAPEGGKPLERYAVEFGDDAGNVTPKISPARAAGASFWTLFLPMLTAMVGYWATLSLNIADFSRFTRSQKDQVLGQLYGAPATMAFYSFVGIAVTCASLFAFDDLLVHEQAPWDPVTLLGRFDAPAVVIASMLALIVATLTTNIAANVVSPAYVFSNLAPRRVGFVAGGLITAVLGIVMMPWKLLASPDAYIMKWLIGYGALLGPIAGIMIADYFVVRRTALDPPDLYRERGRYGRWNRLTIAVFAVAVAPCVPGFLVAVDLAPAGSVPAALRDLYTYAWFVGFGIAFVLHAFLAKRDGEGVTT